jgi:hypothetical protein
VFRLCGLCVVAASGCGRIDFIPFDDAWGAGTEDAAPCTEPWGPGMELMVGTTLYVFPTVTADERELFVAMFGDIYVLSRASRSDPWGAPQVLSTPPNTPYDDSEPSVTGDGLTLYFSSYQMGNSFIFSTTRVTRSDPWQPTTRPPLFGAAEIRDDDLEIFVQDYMTPIEHAMRPSRDDAFGPQTLLPSVVNDGSGSFGPSLSGDGLDLYFTSLRNGPRELFVAHRVTVDDPFTSVEAIGIPGGEYSAVSSDGRHLYYVINTGSGYLFYMSSRCE